MRPDAKAIAKEVVGNLRPHFDDSITDLFDHLETTIELIVLAERELGQQDLDLFRAKASLFAKTWEGSPTFQKALTGQVDLKARIASKKLIKREMLWVSEMIDALKIYEEPATIPGRVLEETLN